MPSPPERSLDAAGDFGLYETASGEFAIRCLVCGNLPATGRWGLVQVIWSAMTNGKSPTHDVECQPTVPERRV
jgi:hypothetical protein